jgi:hypothetical protein
MIVRIPSPRRPENVTSKRALKLLEWVDTLAYVFWVVFAIALALLALIQGWDPVSLLTKLTNVLNSIG